MYKKIISVMSVMLVVFLCFNYDVKADEVIDSSRRYNWLSTTQHYGNVDVTGNLFCLSDNPAMQSVNLSSAEYVGGGTTTNIVSTWESVYLWKFQATYVIKNNSQTYECFDNGRLYSQFSVNAKASTSASGSGTLHDDVVPSGWYIDNIQGATLTNALSDGTMYWSVDHTYYGNTLIIAPGETITFSYDINIFWWEQSFGVGGTTFACNNGSISNTIGYTQQDGYNSYSLYEFVTDQPFPGIQQYIASNTDNIWASVQTLVSQGVYTNNDLDNIISALTYTGTLNLPTDTSAQFQTLSTTINNNVRNFTRILKGHPQLIDSSIVIDPSNDTQYTLYSYEVPVIISLYTDTQDNNDHMSNGYQGWITLDMGSADYVVQDLRSDIFKGFMLESTGNGQYISLLAEYMRDTNVGIVIPAGKHYTVLTVKYYYQTTQYNYVFNVPSISYNYFPTGWSTYNSSFNSENNAAQSTESQVHSSEQSYFQQGNTALGNTGIDNYSFSQEQSGGITGVSNDFVRVWNACGSLNSIWIFSLTLSLALYIIHYVKRGLHG